MPDGVANKGDVCGVILAGGMSLRMGREKALLQIHGLPMVAHLAQLLASVTDKILVSRSESLPALESFGLPVIPDLFPGQGPLAGLHAALKHTNRPLVLLLACDLPSLHVDLLRGLIDASPGFDAVVPRTTDGRIHPLCAMYRRSCAGPAEERLGHGQNMMKAFLEDPALKVRWLHPREGLFMDSDLANLNSPGDLEDFLDKLRSGNL
jgi:molybdopterin-guanine dinucleotide biosynthesis protein A